MKTLSSRFYCDCAARRRLSSNYSCRPFPEAIYALKVETVTCPKRARCKSGFVWGSDTDDTADLLLSPFHFVDSLLSLAQGHGLRICARVRERQSWTTQRRSEMIGGALCA